MYAEIRICHWCNENEMHPEAWGGCGTCPTIPYECTCSVSADPKMKNEPHSIECERSPSFAGERKYRDVTAMIRKGLESTIGEIDIENIGENIESTLQQLIDFPVFKRYKILSCERDAVDPTKFTVTFEWLPE